MIEEKIQSEVEVAVQSVYPTSKFSMKDIEVTRSLGKGHGDFSTNISFKLAGELKKSPKEIACSLVGAFSDNVFEKVEAVNGFINFYLKKEHYFQVLEQILSKSEHYADLDIFKGKKIQVEFISANPTGPLTLANGRGGYGGDVLANVFSKVGAMVEREYYINDGGNQVRILGDSMLIAAGLLKKEDDYYRGPYIDEWVSANPELIQKYKNDNFALGSYAANDVLNNLIKPSVKKMGITYDNWFSEKELISRGEVDEALGKFKEQGITKAEDGALWFMTTKFGDDKDRVIVKADGEKTYFANDAAYHWDKFYKRKFDKVINLWGADHHGYIGRMQAAVTAMGFPGQLTVLIMQMVRLVKDGQEFKMSKRKGTFVTMDDLHELIGGTDASDVTRFFFLSRAFSTQMDFDLDMAKERSDKNPVFYVKYAYARLSSILRKVPSVVIPAKAGIQKQNAEDLDSRLRGNDGGGGADLTLLTAPEEIELIDQMSQLPQVLASIVMFEEYPVHYLTFYAIDLAKKFHSFYDKCKVIDEENLEMTAARLELVKATKIVLGIVMRDLIGIDTPEKM